MWAACKETRPLPLVSQEASLSAHGGRELRLRARQTAGLDACPLQGAQDRGLCGQGVRVEEDPSHHQALREVPRRAPQELVAVR